MLRESMGKKSKEKNRYGQMSKVCEYATSNKKAVQLEMANKNTDNV